MNRTCVLSVSLLFVVVAISRLEAGPVFMTSVNIVKVRVLNKRMR